MISELRSRRIIGRLLTLAMLFRVRFDHGAALASPVMGELDDLGVPHALHCWKYQTIHGTSLGHQWFRNGGVGHEVVRWPS